MLHFRLPLTALLTDLTMTSGFSTIAGSVLAAYISMGVPAVNLVTSSVMSIPASISISKMRFPEREVPVTRGHVVVDRGAAEKNPPVRTFLSVRASIEPTIIRRMPSTLSAKELFSV